jgi:uncharacterized membrane protein
VNCRGFFVELGIFVLVAFIVTGWFLVTVNADTRQILADNIDFSNPFVVGFLILFLAGVVGAYFVEKREHG